MSHVETVRNVLTPPKTIAIVGAKDNPGEAVDSVGRYLIRAGYTVIPVNPERKNVWGLKTHATVNDIPEDVAVDIVDVFRAPGNCPAHAEEAASLLHTPLAFWMQLGIVSPEARRIAAEAGMAVIENQCIKIEHMRLFGI